MTASLANFFRDQLGLISFQQAVSTGMSRGEIRHRLASRRWHRVAPGVFSEMAPPLSPHQRVVAAAVKAGGLCAAYGRTAAWVWHLDGFASPPKPLQVARPNGRRLTVPGIEVIQMRGFCADDLARIGKVPVCRLALTLLQLAATETEPRLEIALDSAARQQPWVLDQLRLELERRGGKGRDGCNVIERLLDQRTDTCDSALEVAVHRLIRQAGLPAPKTQYRVVEVGRTIVKADFAWPELKLVVFVQGYRYHHGKQIFEKDSRQVSELASHGWLVLLVTQRDVAHPLELIGLLRRTHETAVSRAA